MKEENNTGAIPTIDEDSVKEEPLGEQLKPNDVPTVSGTHENTQPSRFDTGVEDELS